MGKEAETEHSWGTPVPFPLLFHRHLLPFHAASSKLRHAGLRRGLEDERSPCCFPNPLFICCQQQVHPASWISQPCTPFRRKDWTDTWQAQSIQRTALISLRDTCRSFKGSPLIFMRSYSNTLLRDHVPLRHSGFPLEEKTLEANGIILMFVLFTNIQYCV